MITSKDVELVRERFSGAAERYDKLAFIQNEVREELLNRIKVKDGSAVIDVGCGTGFLLKEIARRNPSGSHVGVDPARGMVKKALRDMPGGRFLQAGSAQLPFKSESFDLLVSSSAYQWSEDLNAAFRSARNVLKPWGTFQAALFGHGTLRELFESLEAGSALPKEEFSRLRRLPSAKDVWYALDWSNLRDVSAHVEEREVIFRDLWSLLVWLKSTGANSLGHHFFLGRGALERAQEYYADKYSISGGIKATFEVIWAQAVK